VKQVAAVVAVLAALAVVVWLVAGNREAHPYLVRAVFDNAGFAVPGEDVKVAGVKVGTIDSLDVTPGFKAAVVLRIDNPGYQDFRRDASCIVRPQSLIGEKFVECEPTQARPVGAQEPGPLPKIKDGPGKGQYLLPVTNTEQSVDLDLLNNTLRLPYRERLSLILNELGATVAGRGEDVRQVIRRADPALRELDRVLNILASQNRQLESLARNGDAILAPLARERRHVSGALANSAAVAQATAEVRGDLALDIQKLPAALREIRPTMTRLGALSDEMTPVLADLHDAAPDINRFIIQLGPFSQAAIPAVDSLGETAKVGTPAVTAARPVIRDLRDLGKAIEPVGLTARQVLESFQKTGDGLHLLHGGRHQRLRLVRPLPACGADRQHLLDVLDPADLGVLGQLRAAEQRVRGHRLLPVTRPGARAHAGRAAQVPGRGPGDAAGRERTPRGRRRRRGRAAARLPVRRGRQVTSRATHGGVAGR
jgi:phospholipid/cholesterol/gamma-HCH transport system substrate-binding protein